MKTEIRISGSGGQGVILASVILGTAASLYEGKETVQSQSYGPEARGGASKADVIISDTPVRYPKAREIDIMVCLTQKAADKYLKTIKSGGIVIVDSDFVNASKCRKKIDLHSLPLYSTTMKEMGRIIALNVVSLSALVTITKIVSEKSLEKAVMDAAPKGTEDFNLKALEIGKDLALKCLEK